VLLPGKVPIFFFAAVTDLFLLHTPKPCKAYHDEPRLSLRRIGTVPRALIVSTVLFWYSHVSVLDRRVRFDYPERAPAVELCNETNLTR
jgi:hypothetical protein